MTQGLSKYNMPPSISDDFIFQPKANSHPLCVQTVDAIQLIGMKSRDMLPTKTEVPDGCFCEPEL